MLILTRRIGETIMIGDNVTVTVLGIKGNQVRIGTNAPKETAVDREEIFQRKKNEEVPPYFTTKPRISYTRPQPIQDLQTRLK